MAYRVLVSDRLAPQGLEILRSHPEIEVDEVEGLGPKELAERIEPYHALVVRSGTKVTAEVLERARSLRVIGRAGIGVDNIDVAAATSRGIVVMNTPGGNNVTTAEHALALLLASARSIPQAVASLKAGRWERGRFVGTEVCNKVLGIVGLGNIGKLVAERAQGLKMRVVAYDPYTPPETAARLGVHLCELDELLATADFISIHTPLTEETRGLIGEEAFAKMKRGVRIVNCARGGIVDEDALARAIRSGVVAGAALDVFAQEPPPPDHPLLQLEQVIATPHLGAATDEAQVNVAVAVAKQIVEYLTEGVIQNAVNVPSISAELLEVLSPYLRLGEILGRFQAQLLQGAPREVTVEYAGEVAEYNVAPITLSVLFGFLSRIVESGTVNYVNAPHLARERGIEVREERTTQPKGYQNLVTVRVRTTRESHEVAGAIFGRNVARLVKIDGFYLEAVPEGHILLLHNRDVPGVVGAVGTILGRAQINIARLELGREQVGGMAISLVHVDEPVPESVLAEVRRLPQVVSARLISL
ncbi:MAG: D-3-phosphoglycerate dehydrogenase [Candidatus Binatia bacterium]|nr:MAG: D-3-phosphoglycerate dehydrogenase [Candidatus Binatia bacterium]